MRHYLQANHRTNQSKNKEDTPEGYRLFKEENPHQHSTYSADTGPYGISRAQRQRSRPGGSLVEEVHAQSKRDEKTGEPEGEG